MGIKHPLRLRPSARSPVAVEEKVSSNTATATFSILLMEVSAFGGGSTLYTVRKHIPGTFQVKTIETVYKTGKECENRIFSPPIHPS